ncbi:MAG: hypothetical protein C0469_07565 [Cyanobacteria bacterium DS2.3.42]|nr:hypothetical protein [Cyanobacteria bacterium DS2.3.42]
MTLKRKWGSTIIRALLPLLLIFQPCYCQDFKWQKLMDIGHAARKQGNFEKAEEYYQLAADTAEKTISNEGAVAVCLIAKADVCFDEEKYATADRLYHQALNLSQKVHGANSKQVSEILQKQASLEYKHRNYLEAEKLYKRIVEIEENSSNPNQAVIVLLLTKLGNCARYQGDQRFPPSKDPLINTKYADAEKHFALALKGKESLRDLENEETAKALEALAFLYGREEKLKDEEKLLRQVLSIREKTLNPNDAAVAKTLANLSNVLLEQKKSQEAERLINRALAIWRRLPPFRAAGKGGYISQENLDCVITMNNTGVKLLNHGKNASAESVFDSLIHVDPQYNLGYENRSILRRKRGDIKGANDDKTMADRLRVRPS